MHTLPARTLWMCSLIPAVLLAAVCAVAPPAAARLEYAVYDVMTRALPLRPPSNRVVIVDIDERSLRAVGQWPWPRDRVAELVTRLRRLGAASVALDVIFAEPERGRHDTVDPDAVLAAAVSEGRTILGYAFHFDPAAASLPPCAAHPLSVTEVGGGADAPRALFEATGAVCNLPALNAAAEASGFLNAAPDRDGVLRRVPMVVRSRGRVYPSLALAAVHRATGGGTVVMQSTHAHATTVDLRPAAPGATPRQVALDGAGNMLVRYRGRKGTLRYISAIDVLAGRIDAAALHERLVFVGTTALGTREVVATPLDTLFVGVEVQATAADNLLNGDFLRRPEHATLVELLVLLAVCLTTALVVRRIGLVGGGGALALLAAALWAVSLGMMSTSGLVLSPLYPTLGIAASLATMTAAVLTVERRRADRADSARANMQRLLVESLLELTEIRDAETGHHSRRIQLYTELLVAQLRQHPDFKSSLAGDQGALLSTLSTLHDIGKVGISDRVLMKPGPLTSEEMDEMRRHPTYGRDVISRAQRRVGVTHDPALDLATAIVFTHHERWDGGGYPQGLRGASIPVPGRIIAVVDVYDALVAHRPYRRALTHAQAAAIIIAGRGTHFDPAVVDAFLAVQDHFERLACAALDHAVA